MAYEVTTSEHNDTTTDAVIEVHGKLLSTDSGEARSLPLNRLHLSASNVRSVRNAETIPALAAMIFAAGGLLNPLVVVPEKKKGVKGDCFGVVAGGRRLAALQLLMQEGKLRPEAPIPCKLVNPDSAVGLSLTENASQEAMHPADQLIAFKALVDEGKTVGQIAAAFGVSPLTVERRLKLANLAPELIGLYRENKIEHKQLMALAISGSHAEQLEVWNALPSYSRSAYHIEQMLTKDEVKADDSLAVFVGIDAYKAAGGAVRTDLFAEDSGQFLQDGDLLHRLVVERLEALAAEHRSDGWKWVEQRMSFPHHERSHFGRLACEHREPTPDEQEALMVLQADHDALAKRIDELELIDDMTQEQEADYNALHEQHDAHAEMLREMNAALEIWTDAQRATSGVMLSIGSDGELVVTKGLVKPEDRRIASGLPSTSSNGSPFSSAPKARAEYSASLCQNLTAHRSAAVAAALTENPTAALAALLATLIVGDRSPWAISPVKVRLTSNQSDIERNAADYADTMAATTLARADALLDRLPGDDTALLPYLMNLRMDELAQLLAVYVGRSYAVFSSEPTRRVRGVDMARQIESALELDMADWWSPTRERFLSFVPKAKMMEAVTQACGAEAAQPIAGMKKDGAIAAAAAALEGKRWLPTTLQPYPAVEDDDGAETSGGLEDDMGGED